MKKITIKLFFLFAFTSFLSISQTGIVSGTIMDGEFVEPMAFANVLVKGTTIGTTSDFDGKYTLELDPGTYTIVFSFVGYTTQEISDVVVTANQETVIDVTLSTNQLDTVVITTSVKRNTESAVLNFQKKSVTLLDGLSAQSIKKTGAGDLASAVKSVPGVSVQGGKYVYVRGLGDRYSKSILNGVDIPGLDPDRNTIQMDIFPTNILDNIIVVKSATAEYPADFTGGVVDIVTKDFPTSAEYSVSVGAGYNPDMHFNDQFLTYEGSNSDFLGYDNGFRKRPINRYQPIPGRFEDRLLLNTLTTRFESQLKADVERSNMDFDFGFTAGNQYDVGDNKLGYQVSMSYKNNTTFYENRIDNQYSKRNGSPDVFELDARRTSTGSEGINNVLLSGLAGVTFKTELSKFKVNLLHIQNGESSAGFFEQQIAQAGEGSGFEAVVKDGLLYTERSISNLMFSGTHKLGLDSGWDFDWKFSPTLSKVNDKDHRITPLEVTDDGSYVISPSTASNPIRLWRHLQEENWVYKMDFKKKYELAKRPAQLRFGSSYTFKYRDFSIDQWLFNATDLIVPNGDTNLLLQDDNVWHPDTGTGTFLAFENDFQPVNSYEGEQNIYALYMSNEFNVSEKLKAVLGLRTEKYAQFYTGQNQNREALVGEKIIDATDWFPSANLIFAVNDDTNIRASYSRTTARPSFKEASIAQIFDPISNLTFIGNAFGILASDGSVIYDPVRPSYMNNFDLRYELFRERGQMIAFSGFYKNFTDPIEVVFFPGTAEQQTVANLGNAKVFGGEIELRQDLGFVSENLKNLRFTTNASIISSTLEMADAEFERRQLAVRNGESVDRERDLQGQSPFLINAGFDYSDDENGFRAGIFYNVQGETLEVVGTGIIPDVYTKPFNSLNFTLNKAFGEDKRSNIDFKISNILGSERESSYQSFGAQDQIFRLRDPGTAFSIGYSYKF